MKETSACLKNYAKKNNNKILNMKGPISDSHLWLNELFEVAFVALCFETKDLKNEVLLNLGVHLKLSWLPPGASPIRRNDWKMCHSHTKDRMHKFHSSTFTNKLKRSFKTFGTPCINCASCEYKANAKHNFSHESEVNTRGFSVLTSQSCQSSKLI